MILDIFSRYVTGWMVAERETAGLAGRLIEERCLGQGVRPDALTLHSDRGAPMTAKCTAQLLADLGGAHSLGRPRVSNDNPHRASAGPLLRNDAAAVAKPSEDVGAAPGRDRGGAGDRRAGDAPARGGVGGHPLLTCEVFER